MAITKEQFKKAFREEAAAEFSHIPTNEKNINILFSKRFNNKMEKLLNNQKRAYWGYINTVPKRMAIACITIIVLFTTACSVEEIRKPIVDFIKEVQEKFIQYFFEGDTIKEISYEYKIYELPADFEQADTIRCENRITTIYENVSGDSIELVQMVTGETTHYFDKEHGKITQEKINDINIEFFEHEELITAIWIKDAYFFELTYYGETTKDVLKNIIFSIK